MYGQHLKLFLAELINNKGKELYQLYIPNMFQDSIICAWISNQSSGSCKGDSGAPLTVLNQESSSFVQIGTDDPNA